MKMESSKDNDIIISGNTDQIFNINKKILVEFDIINYQKFLQMLEKEQKIRDRSYYLWKDTHNVIHSRKRKDPIKFKLLNA
jgi:hypothetical protein